MVRWEAMYMLGFIMALVLAAGHPQLLVTPMDVETCDDCYLVDTRSPEGYAAGHIPGAIHLDAEAFSETRDGISGLLKPLEQVKALLGEAGIHPDKRIVLYSSMANVNAFRTATRLFWILDYLGYPRVAVLDGGFERWVKEGKPVQTDPVTPAPVTLPELTIREDRLATEEEVARALETKEAAILDIRPPEDYTGAKRKDDPRAGHIPGAKNLPAGSCIASGDARLQSVEVINQLLTEKGVDPEKPVVTYCNTGRQASVGYFMLRVMGRDDVSLYDGSMAEWGMRKNRPVIQGDDEK